MVWIITEVSNYSIFIFNDFMNFIIDNKLTSLLIVAFLGLGISSLINSFKTNVLEYYLNKFFKTSNNNLINFATSFLQFFIIIIFLYFIYRHILKKITERFTKQGPIVDNTKWQKDVLIELKKISEQMKK